MRFRREPLQVVLRNVMVAHRLELRVSSLNLEQKSWFRHAWLGHELAIGLGLTELHKNTADRGFADDDHRRLEGLPRLTASSNEPGFERRRGPRSAVSRRFGCRLGC